MGCQIVDKEPDAKANLPPFSLTCQSIKMDAATLKCVNDEFQPWLGHTSYHNTCVAIVKQLLVQRDMVELHKVTKYKPGKKQIWRT